MASRAKVVHRSGAAAKVDGSGVAQPYRMAIAKHFVYILQSQSNPKRFYTGLTSDVRARLASHNRGECSHTANGLPWKLIVTIEFAFEARAAAFERYLKSGSGGAFSVRHFR